MKRFYTRAANEPFLRSCKLHFINREVKEMRALFAVAAGFLLMHSVLYVYPTQKCVEMWKLKSSAIFLCLSGFTVSVSHTIPKLRRWKLLIWCMLHIRSHLRVVMWLFYAHHKRTYIPHTQTNKQCRTQTPSLLRKRTNTYTCTYSNHKMSR